MTGCWNRLTPTHYLNAEQYKDILKNFDTYKADLGMVLAKKFGYITVIATVPGSPAAQAGLPRATCLNRSKASPPRYAARLCQLLLKAHRIRRSSFRSAPPSLSRKSLR